MKKLLWLMMSLALVLGLFAGPGYGTTVVLTPESPGLDTFVYTFDKNGSYSTYKYIDAGYGSSNTMRTFLQFDLAAIPDDVTITSAKLTLWCYGSRAPDYIRQYDLYHVANDTAVTSTMTWNNQPTTGLNQLDTQTVYLTGSYVIWDLKASGLWSPAGDLTDNQLSLMLRSDTEGENTLAQFRSQEWDNDGKTTIGDLDYLAHRPKLTLVYSAADPPPPNVPIPGSVWLLSSGLLGLVALRRRSRSYTKFGLK